MARRATKVMSSDGAAETEAVLAPDEKVATGSQTLFRGLDLLEAVIHQPLGLNHLAEKLSLTRSTTHRLASALVDRGYLALRPREGYGLGPKLLELGYCAGQQIHLSRVARPYLEALSQETGDAVHLGVLDGDEALYLDKVPGQRRVLIGSRIGERQPVASTGLGKALVLDATEKRWEEFFPRSEGRARAAKLAVWLERMRIYAGSGYTFDLEENEDQIRCVAAPIRGVDGNIVAAISVSSAAQYMDDARMRSLIPQVQGAANNISRELGWVNR
jgi:DNA-binding IclR family transcriptional regulator